MMSFVDWIYSSYPNPSINGRWGWLHITVLLLCLVLIVLIALVFRKKSEKTRRIVLAVLAGAILIFEISRRVINLCKATDYSLNSLLYILLPRPWCAISCWGVMLAVVCNKKCLYNVASFTGLLCVIAFFAYPGVGFNNQYILFENLYSIATHALLFVSSVSFITLRFIKFEYKNFWKDLIYLVVIFGYALLEIYVLKIEADPMYFMSGNDIMNFLGLTYTVYLTLYIILLIVYVNLFYLIGDRKQIFKCRKNS